MKRTIGYNQTLQFENVISRYYLTTSSETGESFEDVLKTIFDAGYSLSDNFFYSMNSDIRDGEELLIQVFMPVNEEWQDNLSEEYRYQTYFQVNNLIATRAKGEMQSEISEALQELIMFVAEAEVEVTTPIFYRPQVIGENVYTDLMIGIREP